MTTLDDWAMELAQSVATRSKDPSTRVGCAILRPDKTVASVGYNGIARGADDELYMQGDRDTKLALTLHAELNAVLNYSGSPIGCTAYVTMAPCSHCCSVLAQVGIARVVCMPPKTQWLDSAMLGRRMMERLGIDVEWIGELD